MKRVMLNYAYFLFLPLFLSLFALQAFAQKNSKELQLEGGIVTKSAALDLSNQIVVVKDSVDGIDSKLRKVKRIVGNVSKDTNEIIDITRDTQDKVCLIESDIDDLSDLSESILDKVCDINSKIDGLDVSTSGIEELQSTADSILDKTCDIQSTTTTILEKVCLIKRCDFVIFQSDMPFTISQPGIYCLGESVNGTITIDADEVVLDLHNKKITSAGDAVNVLAGHSDIIIKDGILEPTDDGIAISTVTNITVQGIDFISGATGIAMDGSSCIRISNCTFRDIIGDQCIDISNVLVGTISDCLFKSNATQEVVIRVADSGCFELKDLEVCDNTLTLNAGQSVGILFNNVADSRIINCRVNNNTTSTDQQGFIGIDIQGSSDITCIGCAVKSNITSVNMLCFASQLSSSNIVFESCIASNNSSTLNVGNTRGFFLTDTIQNCILSCVVKDNIAAGSSVGIELFDSSTTNCSIRGNILKNNTGGLTSVGIENNGTDSLIFNNEAQGHATANYLLVDLVQKPTDISGFWINVDVSAVDSGEFESKICAIDSKIDLLLAI